MRLFSIFLILGLTFSVREPAVVVCVIDAETPEQVANALRRGAQASASARSDRTMRLEFATPAEATAKGAYPDASGYVVFASAARALPVLKLAAARKLPVIDLAGPNRNSKSSAGVWDLRGDFETQAHAAAYWISGPFAHHRVGVLHGAAPADKELARVFETALLVRDARKRCVFSGTIASNAEGMSAVLAKDFADGVSAYFVAASPAEARIVAEAARLLPVPPVVVLSPSALGFEAKDKKDSTLPPPFPDGIVILDADFPWPEALASSPEGARILCLNDDATPHAAAAYEAVHILRHSIGPVSADPLRPKGLRGGSGSENPKKLTLTPLHVVAGKLRPIAPQNVESPSDRPVLQPYDPSEGFGSFSRWSTLPFEAVPDTTVCLFLWTDGKIRTIESDLTKLKMLTAGSYPVVDHLVREKLMARHMAITAEKYLLNADGSPIPGKSFRISMVARLDEKQKPKRVWPCYAAGDDPAAGGRAFGTYCFTYSTFIQRTIFQQFDLLDDPVGPEDLPNLIGVGEDTGPYITGTRRDVIYRLIDNFAGSMALTTAHEVGHLAGLGHDTDDPCGIMNVEEGGGIKYQDGHFTPNNEAALEKSLGRVPEPPKRKL